MFGYYLVTMAVVSVGIGVGVMVLVVIVSAVVSAVVPVVVLGCEVRCLTGVGSWVCDSGCCSAGARFMSSFPAPIITIRSMMLKIKRFIVGVN